MFDWSLYLSGLAFTLVLLSLTWIVSIFKRDVSIVDSMWSLLFLAMTLVYTVPVLPNGMTNTPRAILLLSLVSVWALRLSLHLSWRNWGEKEDRRYRAMRDRHSPWFAFKSLYLVFGVQGLLAWFISLPLLAAATGTYQLGMLDYLAVIVWLIGFSFETIADAQLAEDED